MCGIAGYLRIGGLQAADAKQILDAQCQTLVHRGPDDIGTWIDAAAGIALGHRRLSILDLTDAGHQPMSSASGRYILVLNGEIYNHLDIRTRLEKSSSAPEWRGHSDTESLLAAIDRWGVTFTLSLAEGMFAFAAWDRQERELTLARDRMGEKPLYYGWQGDSLLFGSELKALRVHPQFRGRIDRAAVDNYLRHGYLRAPHSIYQGIFKLMPGTSVRFSRNHATGFAPAIQAYWSLRDVVGRGRSNPFQDGEEAASLELERLLRRSVASQSIADVSLGAFLSGGIDSSLVVALMQAQSSRPVKTFTIGFEDARFNEAGHARAVAKHLGTDHTEIYVNAQDALQVIPRLPQIFDEPFGDSSAIPTFLVSKLARSKVTVSLSGDGGDELFGGYSRYQRTADIWRRLARIPAALRAPMARGANVLATMAGDRSAAIILDRASQYLSARSARACYEVQFTHHHGMSTGVLDVRDELAVRPRSGDSLGSDVGIVDFMMYEDTVNYLPDDILVKVDRAAMSVSLETRVPMLDPSIVEFAWRLPPRMKMRRGQGKWILRDILRRHVPSQLVDREKMGFGVPVGDWLRGSLRDWAESLMTRDRLRQEGIFDESVVRARWNRFVKGGRVSVDGVWPLLMFQSWLDG